jgi:hypothetical protein
MGARVRSSRELRRIRILSDDRWVSSQWGSLLRMYADSYIAVLEQRVIDSDPNLVELGLRLRETGQYDEALIVHVEPPGSRARIES